MKKNYHLKHILLGFVITALLCVWVGCSDEDDYVFQQKIDTEGKIYITGIAADGAPIIGGIWVKSNDLNTNGSYKTNVTAIAPDGSYKINVSHLTPPFVIWADGYAKQKVRYYAYLHDLDTSESYTINVTKFSDAAVRIACDGNEPADYFETETHLNETAYNNAVEVIKDAVSLMRGEDFNPIVDEFKADGTNEFDRILDIVSIDCTEDKLQIKNFFGEVFYIKDLNNSDSPQYTAFTIDSYNEIVELNILQTSDIHNHISGYGPYKEYTPLDTKDKDVVKGGFSRIANVIMQYRSGSTIPLLLIDSGDFLMGTIYDLTGQEDPVMLKLFQALGYDAITLGNHEFDWTPDGLAMILQRGIFSNESPCNNKFELTETNINSMIQEKCDQKFTIPIVATNLVTDLSSTLDDQLNLFIQSNKIVNKKVINKGKLKVGILGLMGRDAELYAPLAYPVTFKHSDTDLEDTAYYSFVQTKVNELRNEDGCHIVVILSHSGIRPDGLGEDAELAKKVTGIDFIASGHAHTATSQPFTISNTIIFSPGEYGTNICKLNLKYNLEQKSIIKTTFTLIPIDDTIIGNEILNASIIKGDESISATLKLNGLPSIDTPIAKTTVPLEVKNAPGESSLGNLTADANRAIANALAQYQSDNTNFHIGVTSNGYIRDNIRVGKTGIISFSDVYSALPLGISPGKTPGYPLMSVYLNAYEIRALCEVAVTVELGELNSEFYLNLSGVRYYYNPYAPKGARVQRVFLENPADATGQGIGTFELPNTYPIDASVIMDQNWPKNIWNDGSKSPTPPVTYRVVMDLYMLKMIEALGTDQKYIEFAPLVPHPKYKDGTVIDFSILSTASYLDLCIDSDPQIQGVQELKEWAALLKYLLNFPMDEKLNIPLVPNIPCYNNDQIQYSGRVKNEIFPDAEITTLTILQTSDLHHHASGYGPFNDYTPLDTTDNDSVLGGYARLADRLGTIKTIQGFLQLPTLIVDSGDFLMGTVYDLTGLENPLAFQFFQGLGYDAITLGNHEFDWAPEGLSLLLGNAYANGFNVPIVSTNLVTSLESDEDNAIEGYYESKKIVKTLIKTFDNGIKVGIIGLMGKQAALYAPLSTPISFNHDFQNVDDTDYYNSIQLVVDDLRDNQGCKIIVALSHSGIASDGTGEDAILASRVERIDIIASGHSHTATQSAFYNKYNTLNHTIIMASGEYGKYICRLDISFSKESQTITDHKFKLIPINDTILGNANMNSAIEYANSIISTSLINKGLPEIHTPIAKTSFALTINELDPKETGLGNLTADANRAIANGVAPYDPDDNNHFYIGVTSNGYIRDNLFPGKEGIITFADIYGVLPLGISPSKVPGYPLISVYFNAYDIRNMCQISAIVASKQNPLFPGAYYLNLSGVQYTYDSDTFIVNQVALYNPSDQNCTQVASSITNDMMNKESKVVYRTVINLYLLEMFYALMANPSYSAFHDYLPVAKDKDGNPISPDSVYSYILKIDQDQELKEYITLMQYLSLMPKGEDDLPTIPIESPYHPDYIPTVKRVLTN